MQKLSLLHQQLIFKAETLAQEERRITVELIQCLEEISRQMIYAEMGFSSLHEFCVKHLKLSNGSAARRIAAMRLARDVPEVKEKILTADLSLSNAAKIQTATQQIHKLKKISKESKKDLVQQCSGLSQRECEVKLFDKLPELKEIKSFNEKSRSLDQTHTELKLILDRGLKSKMDELQNLLSHSIPEKSFLKLIERLVDQELIKLKKKRSAQLDYKRTDSAAEQVPLYSSSQDQQLEEKKERPQVLAKTPARPTIPADLQRAVWTRAQQKCQYRNCCSTYRLEVDHIIPVAHGGATELDNLRLLCGTHNLLHAKKIFGVEKMKKFVPSLR